MAGSVVFGSTVQVSGVDGDVSVGVAAPPRYRVEQFPLAAQGLSPEQARAQPSKLLQPRYQVVPFTGRDDTVAELAAWMRSQDHPFSVKLVSGAGGQGKTRLAGHVAAESAIAGWAIWRVSPTPTPQAASQLDLPAERRVLVVVDYADRWPHSDLLGFLGDINGLSLRAGVAARVLLLARSAGGWWAALSEQVEAEPDAIADDLDLTPLGDHTDSGELFRVAQQRFAAAMRVDGPFPPIPSFVKGPDYAQVLTVHMAALVSVDAHRHGDTVPTAPHLMSDYLLRRERVYWDQLHRNATDRVMTRPDVMGRAVYVATLTGALPRADARTALD
ncbi:MAG: tetratricopeptide repeat protein, partial [Actinomycetota bacterium]|nr:tetratricopeptide repeat protein [Actinomycetota bacterium]